MYGSYGSYGSYGRSSGAGIAGGAAVFLVLLLIGLGIVLLVAAGKILKKAGHNPWKILIPVYGGYLLYKIADAEGVFWGSIVVSVVASIINGIIAGSSVNSYGYSNGSGTGVLIVTIIEMIIMVILQIVYARKLANAFGKGGGFAAGLFFLAPIFTMILGFGSAQYTGYSGLDSVASAVGSWKCPNCGTENSVSRGTCSNCGAVRK